MFWLDSPEPKGETKEALNALPLSVLFSCFCPLFSSFLILLFCLLLLLIFVHSGAQQAFQEAIGDLVVREHKKREQELKAQAEAERNPRGPVFIKGHKKSSTSQRAEEEDRVADADADHGSNVEDTVDEEMLDELRRLRFSVAVTSHSSASSSSSSASSSSSSSPASASSSASLSATGDDDAELQAIRARRLKELQQEQKDHQALTVKGHGQYRETVQDEFLPEVTQSKYVICHFYHRFVSLCHGHATMPCTHSFSLLLRFVILCVFVYLCHAIVSLSDARSSIIT